MNISIGICNDSPFDLNRTFTGTQKSVEVWGSSSILNPTFLLNYDSTLATYNYLEVDDWNRGYWITDMRAAPGGRLYIDATVDYLSRFNSTAIGNLSGYCIRGDTRAKYMIDPSMPNLVTTTITNIVFDQHPFAVENASYLLTVLGRFQPST